MGFLHGLNLLLSPNDAIANCSTLAELPTCPAQRLEPALSDCYGFATVLSKGVNCSHYLSF